MIESLGLLIYLSSAKIEAYLGPLRHTSICCGKRDFLKGGFSITLIGAVIYENPSPECVCGYQTRSGSIIQGH